MMYVEFIQNFFLAYSHEVMGVRVISASLAQKLWFPLSLHIMYVEFMKNFFLTDSSELMGVRVISVSWDQKRLIRTF